MIVNIVSEILKIASRIFQSDFFMSAATSASTAATLPSTAADASAAIGLRVGSSEYARSFLVSPRNTLSASGVSVQKGTRYNSAG